MHALVSSAPRSRGFSLAASLFALALAACDGSPTGSTTPDPGATLTVDASSSTAWALVDLASPAQVVQAADPTGSAAWDLGFQVTKVILNGGESGPAGMLAYCVCQNAAATDEQVMAMTPETERADFEAVTEAQVPAAAGAWTADAFDTSKWYRYNLTGSDHQVWPTHDVYLVKRGNEVFKLQLVGYYGAAGEPRQITFRYARLQG